MTERLLSCLLNKIQLNTKKRCGPVPQRLVKLFNCDYFSSV